MARNVKPDVVSITPADVAHRKLRSAIDHESTSRLELAEAIYEARQCDAWQHDDGVDRPRYERIMHEHRFPDLLVAYCWDEFQIGAQRVRELQGVGELLADLTHGADAGQGMFRERLSVGALKPLAMAGVLNTHDTSDLSRVIVLAQDMATDERGAIARYTPEHAAKAPVTQRHIRRAMKQLGIIVSTTTTAKADRTKALRAVRLKGATNAIRRLSHDQTALRELRALINRMLGDDS
jgi:hypothetical protein